MPRRKPIRVKQNGARCHSVCRSSLPSRCANQFLRQSKTMLLLSCKSWAREQTRLVTHLQISLCCIGNSTNLCLFSLSKGSFSSQGCSVDMCALTTSLIFRPLFYALSSRAYFFEILVLGASHVDPFQKKEIQ
jgi:hypothetical protein